MFPPSLEPIAADCHIGEECRKALLAPAEDVAVQDSTNVAMKPPVLAASVDAPAPVVSKTPCLKCGAPKACETCFETEPVIVHVLYNFIKLVDTRACKQILCTMSV